MRLKALASRIALPLYKLCLKGVKVNNQQEKGHIVWHEDADDFLKMHVTKSTKKLSIRNSNTLMTFCVAYFAFVLCLTKLVCNE